MAAFMKEHTQSLGKLKVKLILIFHLNLIHSAEPFFHSESVQLTNTTENVQKIQH